jgi:hypothetical protein
VLKKIQESVWKIFISLSLVLIWMLMWFKRFRYITILIIIIRYASLPSIYLSIYHGKTKYMLLLNLMHLTLIDDWILQNMKICVDDSCHYFILRLF